MQELEIEQELENDLKRLINEAEGKNYTDDRSRRIVEKFDNELKGWLKKAVGEINA